VPAYKTSRLHLSHVQCYCLQGTCIYHTSNAIACKELACRIGAYNRHDQICRQLQLRTGARPSINRDIILRALFATVICGFLYTRRTCCTASDLASHMCTVQLPQLQSCCACLPGHTGGHYSGINQSYIRAQPDMQV
jgi:hypothetical protein